MNDLRETINHNTKPSIIQTSHSEIDSLIPSSGEYEMDLKTQKQYKVNVIDSKTIGDKIDTLLKHISSKDTSHTGKIKIAEYLCHKLCDIYRLSPERRKVIARNLRKTIYDGDELPIPLRLYYMKFRNETVPYSVSVWLYKHAIAEKLPLVPYFQILKYILHSYLIDEEIKKEILDEFEALFANQSTSEYTKMEIADIFLLNNRKQRGEEMLNILRQRGLILEFENTNMGDTIRTQRLLSIYDDNQNVHGSTVNESVMKASIHLIELISETEFSPDEVRGELLRVSPASEETIDIVLERVQIDTSRFNYKDNRFGLINVFSCLWVYIMRHPSRDELMARLIEEMEAMAKYCTTGHVSRFINVIQGYTDDENLQLRISDKDQIKSVINHYLNNVCANADSIVMDAMIGGDQLPFYIFVQQKMNEKIPAIINEYGDVQEYIIEVVEGYTKYSQWSLVDNVLKINC